MEKFNTFNGWVVKNKWGAFVPWTQCRLKSETMKKVNWKAWKKMGHKIVKVIIKLKEVR